MTRCNMLDTWFDCQSKRIDKLDYNFVTGNKFPLRQRLDKAMRSATQYMGGA